jgi:hypothetical protein
MFGMPVDLVDVFSVAISYAYLLRTSTEPLNILISITTSSSISRLDETIPGSNESTGIFDESKVPLIFLPL